MRCPRCGSRVPEAALVCPSCHAEMDATREMDLSRAWWCPGCGALMPPEATVCRKCGLHRDPPSEAPGPARGRGLSELVPDIGNTSAMEALAGIESAIPPTDAESSPVAQRDRLPRTRAFLVAALLALLVVGGTALAITHPWDPTAADTKAKTPADTSWQGFPGVVESLTGQDVRKADPSSQRGAAEAAREAALSSHERLGELSARVDESEEALRSLVASGAAADEGELASGANGAEAIAIEVSNLVSDVEALDDGTQELSEERERLETLGNWLRNRCDALREAWGLARAASDLSAEGGRALAPLDGAADFARLFEEGYDAWAPSAP